MIPSISSSASAEATKTPDSTLNTSFKEGEAHETVWAEERVKERNASLDDVERKVTWQEISRKLNWILFIVILGSSVLTALLILQLR
jgi:hypothetical protein